MDPSHVEMDMVEHGSRAASAELADSVSGSRREVEGRQPVSAGSFADLSSAELAFFTHYWHFGSIQLMCVPP